MFSRDLSKQNPYWDVVGGATYQWTLKLRDTTYFKSKKEKQEKLNDVFALPENQESQSQSKCRH